MVIAPILGLIVAIKQGDYVVLLVLLVAIGMVIGATNLKAETYQYKTGLVIEAPDYKTAAKLCYKTLNPVFVTEEKALIAIDVCANPERGEVK
jgi:hypothetical protein